MSVGQAAGGVIGAIAGSFLGSPFLGAQLGMMVGGAISPQKGKSTAGPRLNDLSVQTSTYGAVIPRVYGTAAINGNIFWLENNKLLETVRKKKSGGKGGGSVTTRTYTYSATFAIGLCRGPIIGIRRIWIRGNLIYDAGSTDTNTIIASNEAAEGFRVYRGTDTQTADSRIQSTLGVDNTPAWRGLAYIVFYDLDLTSYGNSLAGAQVRAEVVANGVVHIYPYTPFSYANNRQWLSPVWDGTNYITVSSQSNHVMYSSDGLSWVELSGVVSSQNFSIGTDGAGTTVVGTYSPTGPPLKYSTDGGITWTACSSPGIGSGACTSVKHNGSAWLAIFDSLNFGTSSDGKTWQAQTPPDGYGNYSRFLIWSGEKWIIRSAMGTGRKIWTSPTGVTGTWTNTYTMLPTNANNFNFGGQLVDRTLIIGVATTTAGYGGAAYISDDHGETWSLYPCPFGDLDGFCVDDTQFWVNHNGDMRYSSDGINWTVYDPPSDPYHFTTGYGNGFIVCVGYSDTPGFRIFKRLIESNHVMLSTIVSDECLLYSSLSSQDIDVTSLTPLVRGYTISNISTIRSFLEPLRVAWPFDIRQHGYKVQFLLRETSPTVGVVAVDDLCVSSYDGENNTMLTADREANVRLPARVILKYIDYTREYETGLGYAERIGV